MKKWIYKIAIHSIPVIICIVCFVIGQKINNAETKIIEEPKKPSLILLEEHTHKQISSAPDPVNIETLIQEEPATYANRWGIENISQEEKDLLAKVLYLEAHNTGLEGCQKVVVVIFNRYLDGNFFGGQEKSITAVLSAHKQFGVYWRAANDISVIPTEQEYNAIDSVLNGTASEEIINMPYLYFNGDGKQNYFR